MNAPHSPLRRAWSADLGTEKLYALLALRVEVFVVEQDCAYQELDGRDLDDGTRHFWIERDGVPLAYLRLLVDADGTFRVGRVCTKPEFRGQKFARRLLEAALAEIRDEESVLEAQVYAKDVYAAYGYQPEGEEYLEDGIPHIAMRRPAAG